MKQTPMFLMLLLATAMSSAPGSDGTRAAELDTTNDKKRSPQRDSHAADDAPPYPPQRIRPAA